MVRRGVLVVFLLSGLTSLAYEVVWFRVLTHYQQVTTYAFTVMLATFLLGIALGSYLVAPFMRRRVAWLPVLAAIEVLIGLTALASVHTLAHAYDWLRPILESWQPDWFASELDVRFLAAVAAVALGPTTLLLGLAFPIGVQLYAEAGDEPGAVGAPLGRFYAFNLIGGILGSVAAGFFLLPDLGSQRSLALLSLLNILAGVGLLWLPGGPRPSLRLRLPRAGLATAVSLLLAAALILPAPDLLASILTGRYQDFTLLFHEEGLQTSVSVQSSARFPHILFLDGSHQADDLPGSVRLHRMIGHLPMLLHPDPKRALVIGLGGGATAGAISQYEGVDVDVVELAPAVVHGSEFFRHVSYDVLRQPNVHLRLDDGRNYMLLTRQKYDVITADIVHPWHAGSGNLYSTEYYTLARETLTDDGVMCQWIDAVGETEYKLLMRSFTEVFPYVSLWFEGSLLIGSQTPHAFDEAAVARKFASLKTHAAIAAVGANEPKNVLDWYNASRPQLVGYVGDGPLITDNSPYVEYFHSLPQHESIRSLDPLRSPNPGEILKPQ